MGKRINLVWEESVSEHAEIHPLLFCVGVEPGSREGAESGKSCEVTAESKKKIKRVSRGARLPLSLPPLMMRLHLLSLTSGRWRRQRPQL